MQGSRPVVSFLRANRLALWAVMAFATFVCAITWIAGERARASATEQLEARLSARADVIVTALTRSLLDFQEEVIFLTKVPPITGIMRASHGGGYDVEDRTPATLWRSRLQTIFTAYAQSNPDVTQVRLIGLADGGRELVRVDRQGDSTMAVPDRQLQAKADTVYFQAIRQLGAGQTYVSDINLNRENGEVQQPITPTVRIGTPVFDSDGSLFGMLVVNAHARVLQTSLQSKNLPPLFTAYLTNSQGDFLFHPDAQRSFGFDLGRPWRWSDEFHAVSGAKPGQIYRDYAGPAGVVHATEKTIALDGTNPGRVGRVVVTAPESVIAAAVANSRVMMGLVSLCGGLLMATFLTLLQRQRRKATEQQARYAAIVESSHDAIIGKTLQGVVTSWNAGAERIFGFRADEAVGQPLVDLIVPPELKTEELSILERVGRGEVVSSFDTVRLRRDGSRLDMSVTASPIRSADGRIVGVSKTARDISQQKAAEAQVHTLNANLERQVLERTALLEQNRRELLSTRDQLLTAAQAAELGIWTWQLADDTLTWNEKMCQIYGLPLERRDTGIHYEDWHSRVHPDDVEATVAQLMAAVEGRGVYAPEFRIVLAEGSVRFIQAAAVVERDKNGRALRVQGINRDITQLHQAQEAMQAARVAADRSNQAKTQFVANISHEIRSPMNAVLGMLQLLQRTALDMRQQDYASKAESSARALLGLLNDILDFSKVEAGKLELDPHVFDLDQLLQDMAVILSANVGEKPIEVLFDVDPSVPKRVRGDALRLQQILLNLASNAIKFTTRGEVVLSVSRAGQNTNGVSIAFAVRDTGIGISPEHCEHIFQAFSQAEASTTRRFGGTGLGLAISQRLVQLMGGKLEVDSVPGQGSNFHFTITLQEPQAQPLDVVKPVAASTPDRRSTSPTDVSRRRLADLRLLVVEDNPTNQQVAHELLSAEGAQVEVADGGQAALETVRRAKSPFDLILMDIQMPGMDGYAATRAIRAACGQGAPPIVAMTANAMASDREAALTAGMVDHIGKPFSLSQLVAVILLHARRMTTPDLSPMAAPALSVGTRPALNASPGWNSDAALARQGSNTKVYRNCLLGFALEMDVWSAALQKTLVQQDLDEALRLLHNLKGLASTAGAEKLAEEAARAEKTLAEERNMRLDDFAVVMAASRSGAAAARALAAQLDAPTVPGNAAAGPLSLRSGLEELRRLLDTSNFAAFATLDLLQQQYGARMLAELTSLRSMLEKMEFAQASRRCAEILQNLEQYPS